MCKIEVLWEDHKKCEKPSSFFNYEVAAPYRVISQNFVALSEYMNFNFTIAKTEKNHRHIKIQIQLCKDLEPIVHSQDYVKKVTIVMDSIWFDRKCDFINELIWFFMLFIFPLLFLISFSFQEHLCSYKEKHMKHDQTYMLGLQKDEQKPLHHLNMAPTTHFYKIGTIIHKHCEPTLLMLS